MRTTDNTQFERVIIVTRASELDELVARFNTIGQARFYLQQAGQNFDRIETAHNNYKNALKTVKSAMPRGLKQQVLKRELIARFTFDKTDLVVVLGPDGLVSNTAKYLDGQPIFAVNPDPDLHDGVLLPFQPATVDDGLHKLFAGRLKIKPVTMAQVKTSDGQKLLAFNDFFVGAASHVSARYEISFDGREEVQSSSGIIISTGAGSTGWLKSVYRGAINTAAALGGDIRVPENDGALPWDTDHLPFIVREPFPSQVTGTDITIGAITRNRPLAIRSRMATNGVI
ncbi:MAG TPA: sugar kinase, partial [Rhizobiales bacterium]|nr:sugar kinase [Hyphomicrobiales bacterium]